MSQAWMVKRDFDRAAAQYDRHADLQYRVLEKAYLQARSCFKDASIVLDIGAGTGEFSVLARQDRWQAAVFSVDLSCRMCVESQHKGGNAINADMAALPFADQAADGIFSSLALQWADDPEAVLRELHRCLKTEGTALVTLFTDGTLGELKQAFALVDAYSHVADFYLPEAMRAIAAKVGFHVLNLETDSIVQSYDSVKTLALSLRKIGAANKNPLRRKSMLGRRVWEYLEAYYRKHFPLRDGIYARWNVTTMIVRKSA